MYLSRLFRTLYTKLWLKYSKQGKEYAKKYKRRRKMELTKIIREKNES